MFGWILIWVILILSESGDIIEWFGVVMDIMERKKV